MLQTTTTKPKSHQGVSTQSKTPLRFVTCASLFDGHDVAINVIRRMLQSAGCEVIHLAHNRSVTEVVAAAIQEDADGIAVSSYQGGHMEYFRYLIDLLTEKDARHIRVFGGGGGVFTPPEIQQLHDYGVERIYTPADGQTLGLKGMINDILERTSHPGKARPPASLIGLKSGDVRQLANIISCIEAQTLPENLLANLKEQTTSLKQIPVLGVTGTGGAGKSSLVDELILRFRQDDPQIKIAILAIDPSKRKTGGALLGDRIRMNAIDSQHIYMRSLATRSAKNELSPHIEDLINACKIAGFSLIIVESAGIGQGNAAIVPFSDVALYVMTPEYGASSQLEKIEMLDDADLVAINKFDRQGALDAWRDVAKQLQRSREAFATPIEQMPVYGTLAASFNDQGVSALYHDLLAALNATGKGQWSSKLAKPKSKISEVSAFIVPRHRQNYLAEIVNTVRNYQQVCEQQADYAQKLQQLRSAAKLLQLAGKDNTDITELVQKLEPQLTKQSHSLLQQWPSMRKRYQEKEFSEQVRDRTVVTKTSYQSLSDTTIPKVALPKYRDDGQLLLWLMKENVPGEFPYTAGVFHFKRQDEEPGRMFAGEGDAFRTNKRFKYLSRHCHAKRLSTAFDAVTLYGFDPDVSPDIYGKVGNSGVSIATLDDMRVLYDGFDLCDPQTSVSMTINGPAPTILAMFLNAAIDQQLAKYKTQQGTVPDAETAEKIKAQTLHTIRGTVQADILKEDQGQNTCIFATDFSIKLMGDIQEYFIEHQVRNFYSVSISGYHIAEAGANPISQLAFTLANGFTYVEAYLARGMDISDFAPNLSFFFSNGMDPEYSVIGRVARRIWAVVMRDRYGANARSQKLKYHLQTSGRSLHAQEMQFNDIRTTLEALIATYDNCNSLHTNAYDEAATTPTEDSVRRALAIQLIINKEFGLAKNENPNQGSFIIEQLTDLVEEAVLQEFDRLNDRGGVLGAMETGYQRGKIQAESMLYESKKHTGSLPIIGVNTFLNPHPENIPQPKALARSTEAEKESQLQRLKQFHERHKDACGPMLERLKQAVIHNENVFAVLMDAVRVCSLGQISQALFSVGGKYRRNM